VENVDAAAAAARKDSDGDTALRYYIRDNSSTHEPGDRRQLLTLNDEQPAWWSQVCISGWLRSTMHRTYYSTSAACLFSRYQEAGLNPPHRWERSLTQPGGDSSRFPHHLMY